MTPSEFALLRNRLGWTQKEAGKQFGVSLDTIKAYEANPNLKRNRNIPLLIAERLRRLADEQSG